MSSLNLRLKKDETRNYLYIKINRKKYKTYRKHMIEIKEHQQVWYIFFFDKKAGSGISVN